MKKQFAVLMVGMLMASWVIPSLAVAKGTSPLDGKTFVGRIGKQGQTTGDPDQLIFKDGTLHSTACDPYGFKEGSYSAAPQGDGKGVAFRAETNSPTDGRMIWKGTISGRNLEGTATWLKPGQEPVEHWVKAEQKE